VFVLGHAGITIGAAVLLDKGVGKLHPTSESGSIRVSFLSRIDLRVLTVGSLVPDILDKPIGLMILRDELGTGRIFCHTLLLLALLTIAGFWLFRRSGCTWLLVVAAGVLAHLLLDGMWTSYRTLLWPVFGFSFPRSAEPSGISQYWHNLKELPRAYGPEILGGLILAWLSLLAIARHQALSLLRYGRFPDGNRARRVSREEV
jgi:hypothetical protein